MSSSMKNPISGRKEVWGYETFTVEFSNTKSWDSWRFATARQGNRHLTLEQLVEEVPDTYKHPLQYDVLFQTAQFRHHEGNTRVEVYYALLDKKVGNVVTSENGYAAVDVTQALFLFDSDWNTVRHKVVGLDRMPRMAYGPTEEGFLLASERIILDPGTYILAGEVEDRATKRVGTFQDRLQVRSFGRDTLEMSSLLLARRIHMRENARFGRDQFAVLPNPLRVCRRRGRAWFYFEIYNLSPDEYGTTHYSISYQMQTQHERDVGSSSADWTTAISYSYRGGRTWEPCHLRVDMAGALPGARAFRVVVEDLRTGRSAMAETRFRVMW